MDGWMDRWMDGWIYRETDVDVKTIVIEMVRRLVSHLAQPPTTINSLNVVQTMHVVLHYHLFKRWQQ